MNHLELNTGIIKGPSVVYSRRTIADLGGLFDDQAAVRALNPETVVYETYGFAEPKERPAVLLAATTVLYPGRVGREAFMTRGHFHVDPNRGESCLTLSGRGVLLLRDRAGVEEHVEMMPGSLTMIDGRLAHRAANVGSEPLVFFVTWMSDCGHDYAGVAAWPRGTWSVVL